jgi:hypothetical protein
MRSIRIALAVLAVSLVAGAATAHAAPTGNYWLPHANCYADGAVSTTMWLDKIGLGPQRVGYNLWFYDLDRRAYTLQTGWHTWNLGYGPLATPLQDYRRVPRARYLIYAELGWDVGSGWAKVGTWAGSYLTGGDYFGIQERFCRATPDLQVVSGGCNTFGGVVACASRAGGRRVRQPTTRAGVARLQAALPLRRALPPPPPRSR